MLRFIILRKHKDRANGLESRWYETVDIDVPALQKILCRGGTAEDGYDVSGLTGVEVLPPPEDEAPNA